MPTDATPERVQQLLQRTAERPVRPRSAHLWRMEASFALHYGRAPGEFLDMIDREFRTTESHEAERVTRNMLPDFLRSRGFRDVRDVPERNGQTIHASAPSGERLTMRVKLCWRRIESTDTYSAVQLLAKIKGRDWEGSLRQFVERARRDGTTHFLFVQREDQKITLAAQVPLSELVAIWCDQRDISEFPTRRRQTSAKKEEPRDERLKPHPLAEGR